MRTGTISREHAEVGKLIAIIPLRTVKRVVVADTCDRVAEVASLAVSHTYPGGIFGK